MADKSKESTRVGGGIAHISTNEYKGVAHTFTGRSSHKTTVVNTEGEKATGTGDTVADSVSDAIKNLNR